MTVKAHLPRFTGRAKMIAMTKNKLIAIGLVLLGALATAAQQTGVIDVCPTAAPVVAPAQ